MRATNLNPIVPVKIIRLFALALAFVTGSVHAGFREPDALIWGSIHINTVLITADNSEVVVEARRSASGPVVASYRMGSNPAAGNYFSLRLTVESGLPISDENAVVEGQSLVLVVRDEIADRDSKPFTLSGRGAITRVDFGSADADGDGLLDDWETRYFGATSATPGADPDNDGASNLREFQEGTNPTVADANHPADRAPADKRISIHEVTAYGLAWKTAAIWPTGPTPIPISYVTRAGAIWKGGEAYKLDLTVSPTAPLWWTNLPVAGLSIASKKDDKKESAAPAASTIARQIVPASNEIDVALAITPGAGVSAYAVEERVPDGWTVAEISDSGSFATNQSTIRWGIYMDGVARTLTYHLVASSSTAGSQFSGAASFDGLDIVTAGATRLPGTVSGLSLSFVGQVLTVHGVSGQTATVQTSLDLITWNDVAEVTTGSDGTVKVQVAETNSVSFFRARLP